MAGAVSFLPETEFLRRPRLILARLVLRDIRWGIAGPSLKRSAAQPSYSAGAALCVSGARKSLA